MFFSQAKYEEITGDYVKDCFLVLFFSPNKQTQLRNEDNKVVSKIEPILKHRVHKATKATLDPACAYSNESNLKQRTLTRKTCQLKDFKKIQHQLIQKVKKKNPEYYDLGMS